MNASTDYMSDLIQKLESSDTSTATSFLKDAALSHPDDPRPLLLIAAFYIQDDDIDQAEAAYISALRRAPDFWIARFQLGLLQFTRARPAVAVSTWAPLDGLAQNHPLRLFKTAFEHIARDEFEQARLLLCEGITLNTENLPLNRDMELTLSKLIDKQLPSYPEQDVANAGVTTGSHFLLASYGKLN
jgi:tetratricopeptide (TPR) repeat protein